MLSGRLRCTVQAVPHSRIFAACQAGAGADALHQRDSGEQRGVGRAAGQHQLRAVLDRGGDRLVAHHADDMGAAVDDLLADRRRRVERT